MLPALGASAGVVFTNLCSFNSIDGSGPFCGLAQGRDGSFYGTTGFGGTNGGAGTVFKVTTNGVLTSLYSFPFTTGNPFASDYPAGGQPFGVLVQGNDGNFYGTTSIGGTNISDQGTVFKITTNGVLTTLHSFNGNDGYAPNAGLALGSDGNFYGTTSKSGTNANDEGTVFEINSNGVLNTLHYFTGSPEGSNPEGALVQGSDGNFYGTTQAGGTNVSGAGTVFKITTNGAVTTLYSFSGGNDGGDPLSTLVQGSDGYFYGTTYNGSTNEEGTVFKITTNGVLTTLCAFGALTNLFPLGSEPYNGVVQGSDGNFYGTTYEGGIYNDEGTVYEITTNGTLTLLHSFGAVLNGYSYPLDGGGPYGPLVQGSDGSFYGTTENGGTNVYGTVFRLTLPPVVPQLSVRFARPDSVVVSWLDTGSYSLQTNSILNKSNWMDYGGTVTTTNGTNDVTITPPTGYLFFRLASP